MFPEVGPKLMEDVQADIEAEGEASALKTIQEAVVARGVPGPGNQSASDGPGQTTHRDRFLAILTPGHEGLPNRMPNSTPSPARAGREKARVLAERRFYAEPNGVIHQVLAKARPVAAAVSRHSLFPRRGMIARLRDSGARRRAQERFRAERVLEKVLKPCLGRQRSKAGRRSSGWRCACRIRVAWILCHRWQAQCSR